MSARFEIVRSDAPQPWHARFVAANGRIVWTTEQYARRDGAIRAISTLAPVSGDIKIAAVALLGCGYVDVRMVDERAGVDRVR